MFGLFTSCISMVSLIAHYGAKLYYLKKVKASIQQVRLNRKLFTEFLLTLTKGHKELLTGAQIVSMI